MIRLLLSLILFCLLVSCNKTQAVSPPASPTSTDNSIVIKIKEMGCRSCVRRIKKYLYETEGIQAVTANISEKTLTFRLTGETFKSRAHLKALSEKAIIGKSRQKKCGVCLSRAEKI